MEAKIPIVLVHGNGESGAHWKHVAETLRTLGYTQLFAIDFSPPANGSCVSYAQQLQAFVDKSVLPQIGPGKKFAIFAHSLGVTTSRYYIRNLGGKDHVSHAVFMAGANHGIIDCDSVLLMDPEAKIFKQAPEIHTGDSEFLRKLNLSPEGEAGVKYMTISSPHDCYYSMNEESPFIDWADNRVVPCKGHWGVRDSDESLKLSLAFLESRDISLGRALVPHPDRPYGEWNLCEDTKTGHRYLFAPDGTATFFTGSDVRSGRFRFATSGPANLIDIEFPEGTYYGLYRVNVNGDQLALKLSSVNGPRPKDNRYANLYYRTPVKEATPKELFGCWRARDFGNLRALAPTEYSLGLNADGTFKISGKMLIAPQFAVEGKYCTEKIADSPAEYKIHLLVETSTLFLVPARTYYGGRMRLAGEKEMQLTLPSSSRRTRMPQVVDNPVILLRE